MEDITAMEPDPDIAKEMYDHFEVVRKSIALYLINFYLYFK